MDADIGAFLREEATRPSCPGVCCRMVDNWIMRVSGQSALARFGRDFSSDADVERWLAEPGGIAVAVNRVMRACGYAKVKDHRPGDIGLVIDRGRLVMAIRTPGGWVGRDENGMISVPADRVWKAWRLQ